MKYRANLVRSNVHEVGEMGHIREVPHLKEGDCCVNGDVDIRLSLAKCVSRVWTRNVDAKSLHSPPVL